MKAFDLAMQSGFMGCAICGKPLRLATAKSQDGGLPVHEECYLLRSKLKDAQTQPAKENITSTSAR